QVSAKGTAILISRTPSNALGQAVFLGPTAAYHQPNTESALGGRSPTISLWLVPSSTSANGICDAVNSTPFFSRYGCCLQRCDKNKSRRGPKNNCREACRGQFETSHGIMANEGASPERSVCA